MTDWHDIKDSENTSHEEAFDYSFVNNNARIAVYDDMRSAPRILVIEAAPTNTFIENLASSIYTHSQNKGGQIPYTVIREVSENFIHARFEEIVVSIMDKGNTIRFSDQGPGISQKEKAQLPGFTSATEPMKHYIRGVGSGLPIVKDYLSFTQGTITIDDNLDKGAVVTITLNGTQDSIAGASVGTNIGAGTNTNINTSARANTPATPEASPTPVASAQNANRLSPSLIPQLSAREKDIIKLFCDEGALGVTDISKLTSIPVATVHSDLVKLTEKNIVESTSGRKRILTDFGYKVALSLN